MLLASVLGTVSCASKKAAQQPPMYPNYTGQPYYGPQPQQAAKKTVDDIMQERLLEEAAKMQVCEYVSMQWENDDIRAYGIASGFDKEEARSNAMTNAEGELAAIIDQWISDVLRRTNTGVQQNNSRRVERVTQQDQIRMAELALKGKKVECVTYEDNAKDGGVECHICLSLNASAAANEILSQKEAEQVIENAERFREQADAVREEIRFQRTGKNLVTQKAEYENNMQQANIDNQHQRNMEYIAATKNVSTNTSNYSVVINGQTYGPYTYAQLQQMAANKQINPDTYVWREGLTNWVAIKLLPELNRLFVASSMPTLPPTPNY